MSFNLKFEQKEKEEILISKIDKMLTDKNKNITSDHVGYYHSYKYSSLEVLNRKFVLHYIINLNYKYIKLYDMIFFA